MRAKILAEPVSPGFEGLDKRMGGGWKRWELGDPPDYEPAPEMSLAARAERAGTDAYSLAYDVLLENNGQTMLYSPFANYADGNLDCCRDMLLHENTVPGLGDGGAGCRIDARGDCLRLSARTPAEPSLPNTSGPLAK